MTFFNKKLGNHQLLIQSNPTSRLRNRRGKKGTYKVQFPLNEKLTAVHLIALLGDYKQVDIRLQ